KGAAYTSLSAVPLVERNDAAAARHKVHQALECGLYRVKVFVNVGVVELHGGKNHRIGKIVQELGPFVEERRIVFVAFQDEVFALAERKTAPEILGNASDEERGLLAGSMENPGKHGGGGCFAVRPGNHQHLFPAEKLVVQNFRKRAERDSPVQHLLQFNVAARDGVPHDDEIRSGLKVGDIERLVHRNIHRGEEVGHWRIGCGIRPGDLESPLFQHASQRSHGSATNSNQVNVLLFSHE